MLPRKMQAGNLACGRDWLPQNDNRLLPDAEQDFGSELI